MPPPEYRRADEAILRSLRRARARQVARISSVPSNAGVARRAYGSGSLAAKQLSSGEEVWIGQWYDAAGRPLKRHVGPSLDYRSIIRVHFDPFFGGST